VRKSPLLALLFAYNFIGAFDFETATGQSKTKQEQKETA